MITKQFIIIKKWWWYTVTIILLLISLKLCCWFDAYCMNVCHCTVSKSLFVAVICYHSSSTRDKTFPGYGKYSHITLFIDGWMTNQITSDGFGRQEEVLLFDQYKSKGQFSIIASLKLTYPTQNKCSNDYLLF